MKSLSGTKARALREAKGLLQTVGFNGFSFQHVADRLGIRKSSLFEHFSSKEDLGRALVDDYFSAFRNWTQTIALMGPEEKMRSYFRLLERFASDQGKVCPLLSLIGDSHSLPKRVKAPVREMYQFQLQWIEETVRAGQRTGVFRADLKSDALTQALVALSFGSQWMSRAEGRAGAISDLETIALRLLSPGPLEGPRRTRPSPPRQRR